MPGSALRPATEAVRTIAPPAPPALIARIAAWRVRKAPSRLGDITRRHSAKLVSAIGAAGADAGIDDGVGEAGQVRVRPELLVGDVADHHLPLARQREGEVAQPVLVEVGEDQLPRAARLASRVAVAAPMPEAAPVTRAMASVKSGMGRA